MQLNKIVPSTKSDEQQFSNEQRSPCHTMTNCCCVTSSFSHGLLIGVLLTGTMLVIIITLWLKMPTSHLLRTTITAARVLHWNAQGITIAGVVNASGITSDKLNQPFDMIFDWAGNLYVCDRINHRVQKFNRGSSIGTTVAGSQNGISGKNLSLLNEPVGIQVDDDGNVYVVDHLNHRVLLWLSGSNSGSIIAGNGTPGNESNRLDRPQDIKRDPNTGTIYISDPYNDRIMRYLPKASSGTRVAGGNLSGLSQTQLDHPWAFHFDSITNSFIIANGYGRNIVRWTIGDNNWTSVAGILDKQDNTSTTFREPIDVTLDPMGNLYVADLRNHRIQFFPPNQLNGTTIAGVGGLSGMNASLLNMPSCVLLDNQLNLYVVDWYNHRIQKFLRY